MTLAKPAKFKPKANSNFGSHLSPKNSSEMTGPNQALFGKLNATCGERMTQQVPCWSLERRIVPQAGHPRLPAWPWAGRAAGARAGTGPCPSQQGQNAPGSAHHSSGRHQNWQNPPCGGFQALSDLSAFAIKPPPRRCPSTAFPFSFLGLVRTMVPITGH